MRKWKWKRRRKRFSARLARPIARSGLDYPLGPCAGIPWLRALGRDPQGEGTAGANMYGCKTAIFNAAFLVAAVVTGSSSALAQTFEAYHCARGTPFIVGFFKYDSRAHLQIDGREGTLAG